ncbi:hypothetical protein SUTMEG_15950 [Sutterella megalosphaeroides]|uniref:Uncharacterized protein n=1 Tax=Sutterella megalosphaeroides TaxID=2494234 RepID=A0A2Z6IBB8_9BURK|nr:hypothetical protein SUTMEG_15950 [Sutterella megalosphaeroides]
MAYETASRMPAGDPSALRSGVAVLFDEDSKISAGGWGVRSLAALRSVLDALHARRAPEKALPARLSTSKALPGRAMITSDTKQGGDSAYLPPCIIDKARVTSTDFVASALLSEVPPWRKPRIRNLARGLADGPGETFACLVRAFESSLNA